MEKQESAKLISTFTDADALCDSESMDEVKALQNDLKLLEQDREKYKKYCDYAIRLEKQISMRTKRINKTIEKLKEKNKIS